MIEPTGEQLKVIVLGPAGKMGKAMVQCIHHDPRLELVGCVGPSARDYVGRDTGFVCDLGEETGIPVTDDLERIISDCDIVLECTRPYVTMNVLKLCCNFSKSLVSGTTGLSRTQKETFRQAGTCIPVLLAGNSSRMIHVLYDVIREVTRRIGRESDIDIIDIFDRQKLDAPSGTSQAIADIVVRELGCQDMKFTYGREGLGVRREKSIAFTSLRTGGHPGTVKVVFGFEDQKMELAAQVYNMNTYAQGMIDAAVFLSGRAAGFYRIEDVFGVAA